ncbi:MAG TPA: hypothetical protein VGL51_03990 [Solirubrobacteraceae bacterium]
MPQSSSNGARASKSKDGRSTPLWRATFDAFERPVAGASESWLQSQTFMDGLALVLKLQRRANRELRRGLGFWFGTWNLSTGSDVQRLENQIAGLERQVRELRLELERSPGPGHDPVPGPLLASTARRRAPSRNSPNSRNSRDSQDSRESRESRESRDSRDSR